MYRAALDPEKARAYRSRGHLEDTNGCEMCGDVCAIKIIDVAPKNITIYPISCH